MKRIRKIRVQWTFRPKTIELVEAEAKKKGLSPSLTADIIIEDYLKRKDK